MGNLCGNERHEPGNAFVSKVKLEVPYKNAKIMVIQGEVLKQQAQVLINAADEPYDTQVMKSFQTLERLQRKNNIHLVIPGEARVQRLNHQGIQFIIQLKMPLDLSDDVERKKIGCFLRALELAQTERMESLIFTDPPFAVVNQKPRDYNANLFLQALVNFLDSDEEVVKVVKIVNMDSETCKSYIDQINRIALNAEMSFKPMGLQSNITGSGVQIKGETVEIPNHLSPQFKYSSRDEEIQSDQQLRIDVIHRQHLQDEQHKEIEAEKDVLELLQENISNAEQTEESNIEQQVNVHNSKEEETIVEQVEQTEKIEFKPLTDIEHQKQERFQTVSFDQPHSIQQETQDVQESIHKVADLKKDSVINDPQVTIQVDAHVQPEELQINQTEQVEQIKEAAEKQHFDQHVPTDENNDPIKHSDEAVHKVSSEKPEQQQHLESVQNPDQAESTHDTPYNTNPNVETNLVDPKEHQNVDVESLAQDTQKNQTEEQEQVNKDQVNIQHDAHEKLQAASAPLQEGHQINETEQQENQQEKHQINLAPHAEVIQSEPQQVIPEAVQPEVQQQEVILEVTEQAPQQQFNQAQLEKNEQMPAEQQQETETQMQNDNVQSNETAESEPQQDQKVEQPQQQQGQQKKSKKKNKK